LSRQNKYYIAPNEKDINYERRNSVGSTLYSMNYCQRVKTVTKHKQEMVLENTNKYSRNFSQKPRPRVRFEAGPSAYILSESLLLQ